MANELPKLKPCPFCGDPLSISAASLATHVNQEGCIIGSMGIPSDHKESVEMWNTRHPRSSGGRKSKPVNIRGVEYPSAKDAAKSLGITVSTVKTARQNGRLDNVGLGKGFTPKGARERAANSRRAQIHFQDSVFSGWAEATHITGMSRTAMLNRGAVVHRGASKR